MPNEHLSAEEILSDLIRFNTVSSVSNLELIKYIEDYLGDLGLEPVRISNEDGTKANLYATIGPGDKAGIVLSGHTDVVPVTNQPWNTNPFELKRKTVDNKIRLYGRGTADMKGFISVVLSKVPNFLKANLRTPIHIAFSYDEEIGCLGVGSMIDDICKNLLKPQLVIIGEPTSMKIVNAHKGIQGFRTEIIGVAAHSSAPHLGVNAIKYAAEIINFLSNLAKDKETNNENNNRFDPPWTTFNIGQIQGGEALNIIPEYCSFNWEFRPVPEEKIDLIKSQFDNFIEEYIQPQLHKENPKARVITKPLASVLPLQENQNSLAERLARYLTGHNTTTTASYVAEASQFQSKGISAVLCGPGNIEQAHKANEWIELDELKNCDAFLERLISWAKTGNPVP